MEEGKEYVYITIVKAKREHHRRILKPRDENRRRNDHWKKGPCPRDRPVVVASSRLAEIVKGADRVATVEERNSIHGGYSNRAQSRSAAGCH